MNRRAFTVVCCLLTSIAANAQMNGEPASSEQIETGTVPWAQAHPNDTRELRPQSMRHYRIRLLPLSSFPQLPPPVAQQLSQMSCMVPQTYEAHEPENAIQGSFEKPGSKDWAVLCSNKGITTLYVFFQSDFANPIALRHQPDSQWLGVEWSLDYGSAWGIATRPARMIRPKGSADHDGIEDAYVEQSSAIHYYDHGNWTTLESGQ